MGKIIKVRNIKPTCDLERMYSLNGTIYKSDNGDFFRYFESKEEYSKITINFNMRGEIIGKTNIRY